MSLASDMKQNMQLIKEQAHMKPDDLLNSVNTPSENEIYGIASKFLGYDLTEMASDNIVNDSSLVNIPDMHDIINFEPDTDSLINEYTKMLGFDDNLAKNSLDGTIVTGIPNIDEIDVAKDSQLAELTERGVNQMLSSITASLSNITGDALLRMLEPILSSDKDIKSTGDYLDPTRHFHGAYDISIDSKLQSGQDWANRFTNTESYIGPLKTAAESSYNSGYVQKFQDEPTNITVDTLKQLDAYNWYDESFESSLGLSKSDKDSANMSQYMPSVSNTDKDSFITGIIGMNDILLNGLSSTSAVPDVMSGFTNSLTSNYFSQLLDVNKFKYEVNTKTNDTITSFVHKFGPGLGLIDFSGGMSTWHI